MVSPTRVACASDMPYTNMQYRNALFNSDQIRKHKHMNTHRIHRERQERQIYALVLVLFWRQIQQFTNLSA